MEFSQLLTLFQETHQELQNRAARSVDIALVVRNWLFGWYIVEFEQAGADRAELYGKNLINRLSAELKTLGLKGVSSTSLKQCRAFYSAYQNIGQTLPDPSSTQTTDWQNIRQTLSGESNLAVEGNPDRVRTLSVELASRFTLGWSHYVTLLTVSNADERRFYEIESRANSWGARELERQISASLYERLGLSRDQAGIKELSKTGLVIEKASDVIKNPYVLEFLDLEEKSAYSEHELETAIIDKLEHFLLELGKGFLFEARQKRFTFENDHFYVDLVFYNRLLRCYVLIDLKRDKLTHQDLGQMQMYVNYFDRHVKTEDELPTIGIVLCHRKNDALVELTLPKDSNIFASKYQLYLPSKEELKKQLEAAAGIEHKDKSDQESDSDV
ncbi:PDDEXK nuclease domain-containing protein [Nitrosomonas sp.]|uniref:PDDEXK nuclease domain-containing protein n=1 Tax=Nitrosomonas sp. TaxID=42353 RepID=UPI001D7EC781|nr:PDDEXK nuclease domain-containing protein [Nitrosomonas sp.]MBX9637027.1 PDDEXK nuclease domain-containing protein [Nitrosomonas sp.]MBY0484540.1 PDDEXK nuclease domain-containing protein [Nitrosomonas sp.]